METKTCIKCNIEQEVTEFGFTKDTNKYRNECKICRNEKEKEWNEKNSDRMKLYQKEYREKNMEKNF